MSRASRAEAGEICPLCGGPAAAEHRPFCSRRCQDRDLINWLGDGYRIPGPPAAPEDYGADEDGLDRRR